MQLARVGQWEIDYDAASNAASYAADAKNDIAAKCGGLTAQARDDCEDEINDPARANQRDEYDLAAQQTMALWTAIMGGMAVVGVALSGVGVYLIWRTWGATQEAAENSRKTLRSFIAKERAIIKITRASFNFDRGLRSYANGFLLELCNIGESACIVQKIYWSYCLQKEWPDSFLNNVTKAVLIAGRDSEASPHLGVAEFPATPCWLMGVVKYTTLEDQVFTSHFSLKVEFHDRAGYGPDNWTAEDDRPQSLPGDT